MAYNLFHITVFSTSNQHTSPLIASNYKLNRQWAKTALTDKGAWFNYITVGAMNLKIFDYKKYALLCSDNGIRATHQFLQDFLTSRRNNQIIF